MLRPGDADGKKLHMTILPVCHIRGLAIEAGLQLAFGLGMM